MTLTGGASSPYLLLSMGPPIVATLYGGFRPGLTTAILSGALLTLVTLARGLSILDVAPAFALYLLFVVLVGGTLLTSGALESSNVDLSQELVNMIVAQRNYQSNAQTIKTQDSILQTLVSLR